MRGEREIARMVEHDQAAATRNAHKGDHYREPLKVLFDKLYEEVDELYEAVLSGNRERIEAEGGDVGWTRTMIVTHDFPEVDEEED